jgi:23S rRNA pseudouridine955/2504/2580 synthase/23S rRNA pseudouridine1911/1915/1917 synthase
MEDAERPILHRLGLHAEQLIFNWKEKQYTIQAPIPKDLRATLQQLEKWCPQ